MAAKTANVMARVEPEVKKQAESILSQLGVPSSVVINMLYKQIVLTRSIPFPLSLPSAPLCRDEMDDNTFNTIMQRSMDDVAAGRTRPASDVFADLRRNL